ncbi:MAG: hypothetical protein LBG19_00605 [Prevotellaceae bacterium]|jgi:hypothetical protein|nr:hypothetical protein [Prevotellaceae bacterium]
MNKTIFAVLLGLNLCNTQTIKQAITQERNSNQRLGYSEDELISFLDSIGNLNPDIWVQNISFPADSTLNNQLSLSRKLSPADVNQLLEAAEEQQISVNFAQRIFPEAIDSTLIKHFTDGYVPIKFYELSEDFDEFAILIGYEGGGENDVYFFKDHTIISKHHIYNRYGFQPEFFKNENNETVIYYTINYGSGTGIWWYQYNFYKYGNNALIPVLTEVQNVDLRFPWALRAYWIETEVISRVPLQLKFVYNNYFLDTEGYTKFINDSTAVAYSIDNQNGKYIPNFSDTKLNRNKLLTYYIAENDLLFINTHYKQIKRELNEEKRQVILK